MSSLLKSPHLEAFKAKGYEVLLLTDPVDEMWVGSVPEFDGKPLQSVAKGEVDLDSEDEKTAHEAEREEQEKDFADLLTWLEGDLERSRQGSAVVHAPDRVAGLPDHRHLRHHTGARAHVPGLRTGGSGRESGFSNSTRSIRSSPACSRRTRTAAPIRAAGLAETAELLYGTALLAEGGALEDPARFAGLLADRLARTV